jgi:hypothetical protein
LWCFETHKSADQIYSHLRSCPENQSLGKMVWGEANLWKKHYSAKSNRIIQRQLSSLGDTELILLAKSALTKK